LIADISAYSMRRASAPAQKSRRSDPAAFASR
jgi:hypothetical protein